MTIAVDLGRKATKKKKKKKKNIRVAAFTVSEKSINTREILPVPQDRKQKIPARKALQVTHKTSPFAYKLTV